MKFRLLAIALVSMLSAVTTATADDQPVLVNIKRMSLDTALTAARATIDACRKEGVQISVTIVDRGGHPQVVLRDVLAADLSVRISRQKAYTAMTFNMPTADMEGRFTGAYSVPKIEGVLVARGGLPINAAGHIIGGIGVSGAPSGEIDERCARAGLDAVQAELEMAI